jgi:hypothetical protein
MAKHGNHYNDLGNQLKSTTNIKEHFAQNSLDFHRCVQQCRDFFGKSVPMYENLIGPQWTTKGVTVSRPSHITGEYEELVSGDGTYNESDYWATFEIAREDFEQALTTGRYERFLAAVNAGLAAIEAFLNHQYMAKTKNDEKDPELRKDLEWKMDNWPELFTGRRFDKSTAIWNHFLELKALRDEHFQHRKSLATGITRKDLVKLLNKFKHGIGGLLYELHVHFGVRCPAKIIRHAHYPEIEIAVANDA